MATYVGEGNVITITAGGTVSAGDVFEGVDHIGVYMEDAVSGDAVGLGIAGEWLMAKETGVAFAVGDRLYWDATNNRLDKTATNIPAGIATATAASGDTTARCKINAGAAVS